MTRDHVLRVSGVAVWLLCSMALRAYAGNDKEDSQVRQIGSRRELFVDNWLIDNMDGTCLRLHSPVRGEVVFRFDAPWEGGQSAYVTIIRDDDQLRMYYRGGGDLGREYTCLATSRDGIHWTRPELGLFEFNGSKRNNIIWTGEKKAYWESHNFSPFKDANPAAPASQRYKAVTLSRAVPPGESERRKVLMAFVSPDGIHWNRLQDKPIITDGSFDSQNVAFWDTIEETYVCYLRQGQQGKRSISRCTSVDFVNWTRSELLDFGDTPIEHFYTNAIQPYCRAPHVYLGFPMRFVPPAERNTVGLERRKTDGLSDAVFMSSHDGRRWHRTFMEAFIRPGVDPKNWGGAHGNTTPAWGVVRTSEQELSIYWAEHYDNYPEDTGLVPQLRRGTLRLDGFVSVNAPYAGGELVTRTLTFAGKHLVINYSTSAVGSVKVEIQDSRQRPIPGFTLDDTVEIWGDETERVVAWRNGHDVSRLAGRPVRLRFVMKDADLYSIRFRP